MLERCGVWTTERAAGVAHRKETYRGLVFGLYEADRDLLSVVQTGHALVIGRSHHVLVVALLVRVLILDFRGRGGFRSLQHHFYVLHRAGVLIARETHPAAVVGSAICGACQTVVYRQGALLAATLIPPNQLHNVLQGQLGLCLRYVRLSLEFVELVDGLEVADRSF